MEIKILVLGCLALVYTTSNVFADAGNAPSSYRWHQSDFGVDADAPPVQYYIEDSQGRITGADPSVPLDSFGTQNNLRGGLAQIPLSSVSQTNIGDDQHGGQPDDHTLWDTDILDAVKQTFIIHLKGITKAVAKITVGAVFPKGSNPSGVAANFQILTQPNVSREVEMAFDPVAKTINIQRVVKNSDLLNDVKTACQLNLITPLGCKHLEKKAKAIQDALEKKDFEKAEELIKSFLRSLEESNGDGGGENEVDGHKFIKEPALTILIEDAKALLAQVEKNEQGHHANGDHDSKTKDDENNGK